MNCRLVFNPLLVCLALVPVKVAQAQALHVDPSGDVGIGTTAPVQAVDVVRSAAASRFQLTSFSNTSNQAPQFVQRRARGTSAAPAVVQLGDNLGLISFRGHMDSGFSNTKASIAARAAETWTDGANGTRLLFNTTENGTTTLKSVMEITHDGRVKINGTTLNVPDYVFEDDYELMPLDELAGFIREHKHLPGMASAAEVNSAGLDIGGSQLAILEKVEELTLYTIEQHTALQQVEQLSAENSLLREHNARLSARLDRLEQEQARLGMVLTRVLEAQRPQKVVAGISMD